MPPGEGRRRAAGARGRRAVPSDLHFLIRNALTGVVFIVWCLAGLVVHDLVRAEGCNLAAAIPDGCGSGSATATFLPVAAAVGSSIALALALIIGVAIHGLHLAVRLAVNSSATRVPMFDDEARRLVAEAMRERAIECDPDLAREIGQRVEAGGDDDSLFVYAYHSLANSYMIEWARRRRSYGYIGVNWVWAMGLGLVCGGLALPFVHLPPLAQLATGGAATAIFVLVAVLVGREMTRDAEKMELIWAYSYRHRRLGDALLPPAAN